MEEIARTAGVGKDTLYRRWSSKFELARALLSHIASTDVPIPADDDPSFALFVFLQDVVRVNRHSDFGSLVAGVIGEAARNAELAAAFADFWAERRQVAGGLVRDVVGPEPDDREIDRLLDHLLGPVYYRLLLTGAPVSDQYLWDLVLSLPRHQS